MLLTSIIRVFRAVPVQKNKQINFVGLCAEFNDRSYDDQVSRNEYYFLYTVCPLVTSVTLLVVKHLNTCVLLSCLKVL